MTGLVGRLRAPRALRALTASPLLADGALAAALGVLVAGTGLTQPTALVVLLLGATSALAWRRVTPVWSAGAATAAVLTAWCLAATAGDDPVVAWAVLAGGSLLAVAVFSTADRAQRRSAWAALPVAVVLAALAGAALSGLALTGALVAAVAVALLSWTGGRWRRSQRASTAALLERAQRAEREREQQAQLVLAQERAALARELHDVVAHSLAVMTAQADGARFVLATAPGAAADALATVAETGRSAMQDMQGLLEVLAGGPPDAGTPLVPQPQVADLPALVDAVRSGGLHASLRVVGRERELSPGAQLAVFRLAQEALTNALKHAGPGTTADVVLTWSESELTVDVRDDGAGTGAAGRAAGSGSGRGLAGMRHRVEQAGGTLTTGPRPDGGFAVRARVPVTGAAVVP